MSDGEDSNNQNSRQPHVSRVSVKIPPFWRKNVSLWFTQVESQFITSNITNETTKFHYVLAAIESEILDEVSDFVTNPPQTELYSKFKQKMIEQFSDSESRKIKRLLTELELGDKRPSTLLREMKQLAGNQLTEEFLRSLFLQRMPQNIRSVLATSSESLDKLSQMADKIAEITTPTYSEINSASASQQPVISNQISLISKQIEILTTQINELKSNSGNKFKPRNRSRSNSRDKSKHPTCWYHYKFGSNARKCILPCDFKKTQNNNSNNNNTEN